jgi:hypothetical protein
MIVAIPGPINDKGFSLDIFFVQEPPKPAIHAIITVITHHEEMVGRDFYRLVIVPGIP